VLGAPKRELAGSGDRRSIGVELLARILQRGGCMDMKNSIPIVSALALSVVSMSAQIPESLVADGMPAISPELKADAGRYMEFRAASFNSWHPVKRELLVTTRFADTMQLHEVRMPGGDRRQLTFTPEYRTSF